MRRTIKSEILKLLTVRSTYLLLILSLAMIVLFAFYFEGYRGNTGSPASTLAPTALQEIVSNGAGLAVLFSSVIAILFMAHEYRYNTITYTLTANARRSNVLLAKFLVMVGFGVLYGLLAVGVAIGSYFLGLSLRDAALPPQEFDVLVHIGRTAFYYVGYTLFGLLVTLIVRGLVASVTVFLLYTMMAESLLGLLLGDNNARYLPITALDSVTGVTFIENPLAPNAAIGLSLIYLAVFTVISWLLFVRRDALTQS